jgi:hypothetical protein
MPGALHRHEGTLNRSTLRFLNAYLQVPTAPAMYQSVAPKHVRLTIVISHAGGLASDAGKAGGSVTSSSGSYAGAEIYREMDDMVVPTKTSRRALAQSAAARDRPAKTTRTKEAISS